MPKGALATVAAGTTNTTPKGLSAARARVRALYDAKKQRLQARRAAIGLTGKVAPSPVKIKQAFKDDDEDKENIAIGLPPMLRARNKRGTPKSLNQGRSYRHRKLSTTNSSKLLTPIKEEVRNNLNAMCSEVSSPAISDIEGEYVMLKPPSNERCGDYMNISPDAPFQSVDSQCDNTSIWVNTGDDLKRPSSYHPLHSPLTLIKGVSPIRDSPVKYASSDAISELYTSKSLKDLSQISRISHSSIHEQVSGTNLNVSGAFHSTFNYPLHSTLRYPLNTTLAIDLPEEITVKSCDEAENDGQPASDARTTVSEPSVVIRSRSLSPHTCNIDIEPRYLDDSYMDNFKPVNNNNNGEFKLPRPPPKKQRVKKTPQTQVPMLCKEHGLHPNFGGPCIFQTDDSFTLTDDSQDELQSDQKRNSKAVTETDCDSSYLSECMDNESHCGMGFSEAEEMTATYDARNGRMRMLRRQTGQTSLQNKSHLRAPIGLSESDFFDVTRKHFSMEATRSSLPDLSALSTPSEEGQNSESTIHASKHNNTVREAADKTTPPASLQSTLISGESKGQRPLSIATTSTSNTSPDSNTGCQVPANSPNITDTNSSSRQNTDNYDYVEVPIKKHAVMEQLETQQASRPVLHNQPRRRRTTTSRSTCTLYSRKEEGHCSSTGTTARKCLRYNHGYDSGFSTPVSKRTCMQGRHITITDTAGSTRTVVQHSAVARNLQKERKRQLVKKLKQFNSNFQTAQSTGSRLQNIKTLGHF